MAIRYLNTAESQADKCPAFKRFLCGCNSHIFHPVVLTKNTSENVTTLNLARSLKFHEVRIRRFTKNSDGKLKPSLLLVSINDRERRFYLNFLIVHTAVFIAH